MLFLHVFYIIFGILTRLLHNSDCRIIRFKTRSLNPIQFANELIIKARDRINVLCLCLITDVENFNTDLHLTTCRQKETQNSPNHHHQMCFCARVMQRRPKENKQKKDASISVQCHLMIGQCAGDKN